MSAVTKAIALARGEEAVQEGLETYQITRKVGGTAQTQSQQHPGHCVLLAELVPHLSSTSSLRLPCQHHASGSGCKMKGLK